MIRGIAASRYKKKVANLFNLRLSPKDKIPKEKKLAKK
jgi:hypothetical protein